MGIIKIIVKDLKSDFEEIKKLIKSSTHRKDVGLKLNLIFIYIKKNFKQILKEYWIWYLIMLFAFCCGFVLASAYYSSKCSVIVSEIVSNFTRYGGFI